MTRLTAGTGVDAATLTTSFEALDAAQVRVGSPATRHLQLDETPGRTVGIWEHTPGVSTDVEADEVFVVLAGSATLEFEEPALPPVELAPGVVVRLTEGMRTIWSVRETLRKVYIAP